MNFNEKLFELRKQNGLSQEELSYKLNVARQTISKWEVGTTAPDMDNLIKISKIFEISIDELVGNENILKEMKQENIAEDENKNVSSKRKIIKIILLYIFILILGVLITFFCIVYRRYKIIEYFEEAINNMKNKTEYGCWKSEQIIDENEFFENLNYNATKGYYNDYKVKDDILIISKEKKDFNAEQRLVNIEYINNDLFYDIDVENRVYSVKEYKKEKDGFYNFTGIDLESEIYKEFEIFNNKNKFKLALDFDIEIKEYTNPDDYVCYIIEKKEMLDSKVLKNVSIMNTYMLEKPGIRFSYLDCTDSNYQKNFSFEFGEEKFEDSELEIPDLSEYVLVENIE